MAAVSHYASGIAEWAKVFPFNKDSYLDQTMFTIDLVVDEDNARKIKASGTKLKPFPKSEGRIAYKFRRREIHPSIPEFGGPPQVVIVKTDESGEEVVEPFNEAIGNGSKVTLKYTVYDSAKGKGTRLEAVRVDELVPFQKGVDNTDTSNLVGVAF